MGDNVFGVWALGERGRKLVVVRDRFYVCFSLNPSLRYTVFYM